MKKVLMIILLIVLGFYLWHGWLKYYIKKDFDEEKLVPIENYYSDTVSNDLVKIIDEENEAYLIRLKLIDEAKSTLTISYYDIGQDKLGDLFLAKCLDAARRGVRVTILVDSLATGSIKGLESLANHPNTIIKEYNHFNLLDPRTIHDRLHDKYIIVDDTYLLLGGRNIGEKYLNDKSTTRDRDVLVKRNNLRETSVIDEVNLYAKNIFDNEFSTLIKPKTPISYLEDQLKDLENYDYKSYDLDKGLMKTNKITLLTNPINRDRKEPTLLNNLINLANSSKEYLMIQSPYFVMDKNLYKLFDTEAKKEIVTNSVYSTPNLPAFSTYTYSKKKLLKKDIDIYEYNNVNSVHQKAMLVDDRITVIGSFNVDPRSAYIDTEMMLVIDSKEVQDQFIKQYEEIYLPDMVCYKSDGSVSGNLIKPSTLKSVMYKIGGAFFSIIKSLL